MTKLVDLTHFWDWHTPPWSGYPSSKVYYIQRMADGGVVSQYIETSLHMGTHMDAQLHMVPNGADIASIPLDILYSEPMEYGVNILKEQREILKTNFRIHYTDYLKLISNLHDEYRKLVNNALSNGYVFIQKRRLIRLIQEYIRNKLEVEEDKASLDSLKKQLLN